MENDHSPGKGVGVSRMGGERDGRTLSLFSLASRLPSSLFVRELEACLKILTECLRYRASSRKIKRNRRIRFEDAASRQAKDLWRRAMVETRRV